jgi:3-deoxy-D-manno-octulosonic-acid transferase
MHFLLNGLYFVLSIVCLPLWICRIVRGRFDIGGVVTRMIGSAPAPENGRTVIWMHGASVGEILLLQPLVDRIQESDHTLQIIVSAYTRDGLHVAKQIFPDLEVFYLPFDLSWAVRRVWRTLNPCLLVLSELELWPNLLLGARQNETPVMVVSSRIHDTDFAFYRRISWLHQHALSAVKWWGAQTAQDAERIRSLSGTSGAIVEVTGSLKYDVVPGPDQGKQSQDLRRQFGFTPADRILVGGSTHSPEEEQLLSAFRSLKKDHEDLYLVLVPRHPFRAAEIVSAARACGLSCLRFDSAGAPTPAPAAVTVIDSIGLLPAIWALADFVFVGGTLAEDRGGQSMIEPALLAKPMCFGPHVWNFQQTADGLLAKAGAVEVHNDCDIATLIGLWLADRNLAASTGNKAAIFATSSQGATRTTCSAVFDLLNSQSGRRQDVQPPLHHH